MNTLEKTIQEQINLLDDDDSIPFHSKNIGDKYHSIGELYEFRMMYNAALFNEWANSRMAVITGMKKGRRYENRGECKYNVHKSWKHEDGEQCFGSDKKWFIVCAMLPDGLIFNHYKAEHWDLFNIPEVEKALYEFDGHTGKDVLERLKNLTR